MTRVALVTGGARSGKSAHAEALARRLAGARGACTYIATAEAFDDEMRARIAQHRAQRGAGWTTREAPLDLAAAIGEEARPGRVVLVDCLTVWIGNLMHAGRDVAADCAALVAALAAARGPVVLVAREVGLGIVPDNAMAREFRDHAGRLSQAVAAVATHVDLVAAGLPLALKRPRRARRQARKTRR
ncbi:MAG: bifunctional adenosylcobinamide kinase/adenosylcobinamide-phosphate guanylyltransferase [Alphaproteobacteria bacterium]|nr:bifunctional adenosylcobinamide kinase/adenosylcobinamide-phosphate guanylyltransferase [Alphaproteobacteria bacterium]